jgi:hypothetical protein
MAYEMIEWRTAKLNLIHQIPTGCSDLFNKLNSV